jgi:penicillin-binding protein 2
VWVFGGVVALLLLLLVARLWYLQVLRGESFRQTASANRQRTVRVVAPRGVIQAWGGETLVTNRAQFTVYVEPGEVPQERAARARFFADLAALLEVPPGDLRDEWTRNWGGGDEPVPVAGDVTLKMVARIAENRLRLPGVSVQSEPVRAYPAGRLAAHLLGAIGQITQNELADGKNAELGYRPGDFIGKTGVEYTYNPLLSGRHGGTTFEIDARGQRRRELSASEPAAGATLRLTLDLRVQQAAERGLGERRGAVVALDPRDGRVLALVNRPAYDPNVFARRPLRPAVYRALIDPSRNFPLQNRAIASPQPPGSTFKIVTAAAGLASGAITARTGDYCRGGIPLGGRIKRCHGTHRAVGLTDALAASCDVFFYHAGFRIGPTPLAEWAGHFALGVDTGIDLPSEKAGTIPSPAWKQVMAPKFGNPDPTWYKGDTANMSIGQGDVQATPLQMALVAAGIAHRGVIYRPQVVEHAIDADGRVRYRRTPEVMRRLPLGAYELDLIDRGLRAVVAGRRGTSHAAALPNGIRVAGKSGSAEIHGGGPTHGWFNGYAAAPSRDPTIAVCVFLETQRGGPSLHGGSDAAPIARKVMAAHFGLTNAVPGRAHREAAPRWIDRKSSSYEQWHYESNDHRRGEKGRASRACRRRAGHAGAHHRQGGRAQGAADVPQQGARRLCRQRGRRAGACRQVRGQTGAAGRQPPPGRDRVRQGVAHGSDAAPAGGHDDRRRSRASAARQRRRQRNRARRWGDRDWQRRRLRAGGGQGVGVQHRPFAAAGR